MLLVLGLLGFKVLGFRLTWGFSVGAFGVISLGCLGLPDRIQFVGLQKCSEGAFGLKRRATGHRQELVPKSLQLADLGFPSVEVVRFFFFLGGGGVLFRV